MARYKYIDTNPRLLAVDLAKQLLPGTFEHALHHLLTGVIDLSHFDARFRNDTTGAPAYPPAMLLQVILFAYSQGIVSSRGIERACQELFDERFSCHCRHDLSGMGFEGKCRRVTSSGSNGRKNQESAAAEVCDARLVKRSEVVQLPPMSKRFGIRFGSAAAESNKARAAR